MNNRFKLMITLLVIKFNVREVLTERQKICFCIGVYSKNRNISIYTEKCIKAKIGN